MDERMVRPPRRVWLSVCACDKFRDKLCDAIPFKTKRECEDDTKAALHQLGGKCSMCGVAPKAVAYALRGGEGG